MARKPLHTQEEVFAVADRLAGEGREVVPSVLLRELGGGSLTTLYKHHEAWLEKRKAQAVPVPIEMPEAAHAAFRTLWAALTAEASKEIASIREKADADVKAAERRFTEALDSIASLERESESESARADALAEQLAQLEAEAQNAATAASVREAGLTATIEELRLAAREHAAREVDLSSANTSLREQLAALQGDLRNAHEHIGALRGQVEVADNLVSQLRLELETRQREQAASASREAGLASAVDELRAQLKDQKLRSAEAINRVEESRQRVEAELSEARRELRANASATGQATGELEALRAQVTAQNSIIASFKESAKNNTAKGN